MATTPTRARQTARRGNPFGFSGQFGAYDDGNATGLVLMGFRYYDPQTGRFLTKDPIGYAGGLNLYAYAGNNPVNYIDPLGLAWWNDPDDFLQDGTNFSNGFVHRIGFGFIPDTVNRWLGTADMVDPCAGAYAWGSGFGTAYNVANTAVNVYGIARSLPSIVQNARNLPSLLRPGNWRGEIDAIRGIRAAGPYDAYVTSEEQAVNLINKAIPDLPQLETYAEFPRTGGWQLHPPEPGVNELPHIKYSIGKGVTGSHGHIFWPLE